MLTRSGLVAAFLISAAINMASAQEPPKPDTVRKPVQTLPTIQTSAPRDERVQFEAKPNVGTIQLTASELTSAPRFFGESDILRAIRLLPGVSARNDFSAGMNVRGGEGDQNLILLDGIPVYNPFHMGGLFGAFVEPMVDRVTFYTAAFPASYGGRLSSVLDLSSSVEPRPGTHGEVNMSFVSTTLALGGAMQQGEGSWTLAARRSYADKAVDLIQKDALPYHFRDAQFHLERVLPFKVRMSLTAYDNIDQMKFLDGPDAFVVDWGNSLWGVGLSRTWYDQPTLLGLRLGDSARVTSRVYSSGFATKVDMAHFLTLGNRARDNGAGVTLTSFSARHTRSIGVEGSKQRFTFDANYPLWIFPSDTLSNRNSAVGAFFDDLWRASDHWIFQLGGRVDAVHGSNGGGGTAFQPRASAKYFVTRDLAVTAATGTYLQWTHSLAREDVPMRALDFWVGSSASAPMSTARHFVLGVERWLSPYRALKVEAFLKKYPSLVEQNPYSDASVSGDEFLPLHGASYGGDLMLRQFEHGKWSGWLSYSYSLSTRVQQDGTHFFPGQDRRHELNLVASHKGARWTRSMRFNFETGTPYTLLTGAFQPRDYDPGAQQFRVARDGPPHFLASQGRNGARLPISHRFDVSFTRRSSSTGATVTPYFSILNVYNRGNIAMYLYNYDSFAPERIGVKQLPIFPSFGLSIAW